MTEQKTMTLPVLPLRDIVVFPGMVVPLFVGREKSVRALEEAVQHSSRLFLVTQRDPDEDNPDADALYSVGVVANVLQLLRLPDGTVKVLVEGEHRAQMTRTLDDESFMSGHLDVFADDHTEMNQELEVLSRSMINSFENYIKLNKKIPSEILESLRGLSNPSRLADAVATHVVLKISEKQSILDIVPVVARMEKVFEFLEREVGMLGTEKKIRNRVRSQMEQSQRDYFLNEQMKAIQKELGGEGEDGEEEGKSEIAQLKERIENTKLSKEAREKAVAEVKKLQQMSPMSSEATVVRNYLDWLLDIPWKKRSKISYNLDKAQQVLDRDHAGLEKVKERIVEYLAVQKRTKALKGPILCLVGPPGVGKTSLAKSVAEAVGRNFARISLGGVRDESEIRGHRRTYIGAMPGKIVQSMKKAKTSNPLFLLDEIDKMGQDYRGDPASALLEVLDPEQNNSFNDHYLEVDYDLSDVMFITTANSMNMPRPLMDRMEVIRLSGYTEDEKVDIAQQHLLPKQLKSHGLKDGEFALSEAGLRHLIQHYTRESGVRNLEREIATLARKAVTEIVKGKKEKVSITPKNLKTYAGVQRFDHNVMDKDDHVGVTTGLAYTEVGGDLLPIEAVIIPGGSGKITLTGKLGEVMQESAQAAWSYVRSRADSFGIKIEQYKKYDIHIHVPEGATPKDGPSAGAAMCTSIVSAFTGIAVNKDVAMTGEISLRGMVMPIGGLKEKLLAALRGGMTKVLIPEKNVKDLEDIPDNVKKGLEIVPVTTLDDVLSHALTQTLSPLNESEIQAQLAKLEAATMPAPSHATH